MTFSQYAGIAIVPTLSRIVLAAVFITAGWMKFRPHDYTAEQAATLKTLNVSVSPKATPVVARSYRTSVRSGIRLASYQTQPDANPPTTEPATPDASPHSEPETEPAIPPTNSAPSVPTTAPVNVPTEQPANQVGDQAGTPSTQPLPAGTYTASRMHGITLMLHDRGWPMPVFMAWAATMTELIGGALLAIGLFSRLWGLGLAIVMGVAMYFTSWPALLGVSFKLFNMSDNDISMFTSQSALFVLAFGIFLTGPGPLSLDRFLFASRHDEVEVEVVKKA